jgi:anti-sigma B factor antagonist
VEVSFDETEEGDAAVLVVRGEVDLSSAPQLRQRLLGLATGGPRTVVVDLTGVSFIDSTGLGVLVSALKRLRAEGGDLRLAVDRPQIAKVLEITGLDTVFLVAPTVEEAARR